MFIKKYFTGFSFTNNIDETKDDTKFEITIGQAISKYFHRFSPINSLHIHTKQVVEKYTKIPDSIIDRMKEVDNTLNKVNITSFYFSGRMHRRLKRNPFSSFGGYNIAVSGSPEEERTYKTPLEEVRKFYTAAAIRKIIKDNNINVRVTNTSGLVFWCESKKDLARIKILSKGIVFGEAADVSDIGKIEEDIVKLVEE